MPNKYNKYDYKYNIIFDGSLKMNERMVVNKIVGVLTDVRGWSKFGYKFTLTQVMPDFIITIARNETIKKSGSGNNKKVSPESIHA